MMELICPEKHKWKTSWNRFSNGRKCFICSHVNNVRNRNQKHSYDFIKDVIEKEPGYKLKSESYRRVHDKLIVCCNKGHEFKIRYHDFIRGGRCPDCSKSKHYSKGEKEVLEIVNVLTKKKIISNDRTQILNPETNKYLELDVYIPELKKAIEYNGFYWHNNKYSKYKDDQKQIQCKKKGIDLLVIEDKDWMNNKDNSLKKLKIFIKGE